MILLYSRRNHIINEQFTPCLCHAAPLLIALPLVEEVADGHKPYLLFRPVEKGYAVKNQSGKQLIVAYPTTAFGDFSSSLSISRLVPLNMASIIAFL